MDEKNEKAEKTKKTDESTASKTGDEQITAPFDDQIADDFKQFVRTVRRRTWQQLVKSAPFELPPKRKKRIVRDSDGLVLLPFYAHLGVDSADKSTARLLCCITQKADGEWFRCPRKASRRFFTEALQDVALRMKLPIAVHSEGASHLRICRYHERIIDQFEKRPHAVQLKPLLFDESDVEKKASESEEDDSDEWMSASNSDTGSLKNEPLEKWEYEDGKTDSTDEEAARQEEYRKIAEKWNAAKERKLEHKLKRQMERRFEYGNGEASSEEENNDDKTVHSKSIRKRKVGILKRIEKRHDDKKPEVLEMEEPEQLEDGDKIIDEIVEEELIAEKNEEQQKPADDHEQVLEERRVEVKYVKNLDEAQGELIHVIWQKNGQKHEEPEKKYKIRVKRDAQLEDGIYRYVPRAPAIKEEAAEMREEPMEHDDEENMLTDELECNELRSLAAEFGLVLEKAEPEMFDEYPPDLYEIRGAEEEDSESEEEDEISSDSDEDSDADQEDSPSKRKKRKLQIAGLLEEEPNQKKKIKTQDLLSNLSAASLRRYRRYFGIKMRSTATKGEMLSGGLCSHFDSLPNSRHTIPQFIHINRSENQD
ncbi:hypothetical protein WR25_18085 [Diploscapter pachys]|uniref:Histone deacetylase complex subunit SAP30 Sin3 binding domain-containing protein n=1 Tax=Diploscapter pachys TaxID=2018661 RepID=A0A2A2LKH5_9BILA|nr:hypothetical protein WR25_18085 [Diploscapter pachys]